MTAVVTSPWIQLLFCEKHLYKIAVFLPFHEALKLGQVCTKFKQLLSEQDGKNKAFSHFVLYCNATYMIHFKDDIIASLCKYANRSLSSFRMETLGWFQKSYSLITPSILKKMCEVFSNLEVLSLPMCSSIGYDPSKKETSAYSCLTNLRRLHQLHTLDLTGCNITDYMMPLIAQCKSLTELNLSINKFITDKGIKELFLSEKYKNNFLGQMKALDLSYTSVSDEMFQHTFHPQIGALNNLKQLHVMNTKVTDKGLAKFFENQYLFCTTQSSTEKRIMSTKLERINIFNCELSSFLFLSGCEGNEVNDIKRNSNVIPTMNSLRKWSLLESLKGLCLNWNNKLKVNKDLIEIGSLRNLKELVICNINIWNHYSMKAIASLSNLETFSLRCETIENSQPKLSDLEAVNNMLLDALISCYPKLKKIDLHAKKEDFIQHQYLRQLSKIKSLEYIHLQSENCSWKESGKKTTLDEEIVALLNEEGMCENLKYLSLIIPYYSVGEKGFAYLAKLKTLEELNIRFSNSIFPKDIVDIIPKFSHNLKVLQIDQFCEEVSEQLSPGTLSLLLKPLRNLKKLVIANQQYQSKESSLISQRNSMNFIEEILVKTCKELQELRIDLNCFRCTGQNLDDSLKQLGQLSQLQILGLSGGENQWSKNRSLLPLSKSLKHLVQLHLPQFILDQISVTTLQRLFLNTITIGPDGPIEATLAIE